MIHFAEIAFERNITCANLDSLIKENNKLKNPIIIKTSRSGLGMVGYMYCLWLLDMCSGALNELICMT